MKEPRTYSVGITTTVRGRTSPVSASIRRLVTIEAADGFRGEAEEAIVHETRLAWRQLQRRLRDLDDGVAP
jgi:hypothetical protein